MNASKMLDMKVQYELGYSIRQVAQHHRVSFGTVRYHLLKQGVKLRGQGAHTRRDQQSRPSWNRPIGLAR